MVGLGLAESRGQFADFLVKLVSEQVELCSLEGLAGSCEADAVESGEFKAQPFDGELISQSGGFQLLDRLMGFLEG